jgi:hypothetical protein
MISLSCNPNIHGDNSWGPGDCAHYGECEYNTHSTCTHSYEISLDLFGTYRCSHTRVTIFVRLDDMVLKIRHLDMLTPGF